MFGFLKKNKDLENLILKLNMDASNNYKDNAQDDFRRLKARFDELKAAGKLNAKQLVRYGEVINDYAKQMKNYTHADQGRKNIGTWD